MKKNVIIIFCSIIIIFAISFGYLYFSNQEAKVSKVIDISHTTQAENTQINPVLSTQEGLPTLVEDKRQAIYRASLSRDLNKLIIESEPETSGGLSFYSFDPQGKSKFGLSGFTELIKYEKI